MSFKLHVIMAIGIALAACGGGGEEPPAAGGEEGPAVGQPTVGDPEVGEDIFGTRLEDEPGRHACAECHTLGERSPSGFPSLLGLSEDAGGRIEGMSAEEFLRESIVDPSAFVDEEYFDNVMPKVYGEILTEEEIDNLIAFLLAQ